MPRYFFHLDCDGTTVPDGTGLEFGDADQAWEATQKTARELMLTEPEPGVNWLTCAFVVMDEAGEVVFEFPFSEAIEVPPRPN